MYRKYRRSMIIILWVLGLTAGTMYAANTLHAQRSTTVATRQIWEYKMLYKEATEADLDPLGAQGWELVTATPGQGNRITFVFKRPK